MPINSKAEREVAKQELLQMLAATMGSTDDATIASLAKTLADAPSVDDAMSEVSAMTASLQQPAFRERPDEEEDDDEISGDDDDGDELESENGDGVSVAPPQRSSSPPSRPAPAASTVLRPPAPPAARRTGPSLAGVSSGAATGHAVAKAPHSAPPAAQRAAVVPRRVGASGVKCVVCGAGNVLPASCVGLSKAALRLIALPCSSCGQQLL